MGDQNIRERAYYLWEKEGSPPGRQAEFWEQAWLQAAAMAEPAMHTPLGERSAEQTALDGSLAETFPASDPPAATGPGR